MIPPFLLRRLIISTTGKVPELAGAAYSGEKRRMFFVKILALFTKRSHTLLRRVLAPYTALSQRGHAFTFRQVAHFDADMAFGADLTVLPNWVFTPEELDQFCEVSRRCSFVYDLSNPDLLQLKDISFVLQHCRAITVPNAYLQREVQVLLAGSIGFGGRGRPSVYITPSVLDIPFFMQAHHRENKQTFLQKYLPELPTNASVIGCFGPQNWSLVKQAMQSMKEKMPAVTFLGDARAAQMLPGLVTECMDIIEAYPYYLNFCLFGLCPQESQNGQDTFWLHEYGIFCRPVIASANSLYTMTGNAQSTRFVQNTPDAWEKAMHTWLTDQHERAMYGQAAFQRAQEYRNTRQAEVYLKVMQRMLPHSRMSL